MSLKRMINGEVVNIAGSGGSGGGGGSDANVDGIVHLIRLNGAFNLLENTATTSTSSNVTFTVNSDGTITTTTSSAASDTVALAVNEMWLNAGSYKLSGCPTGGNSSSKYAVGIYKKTGNVLIGWDVGAGKSFTLSERTEVRVVCKIASGYEILSSVVFKPMITYTDVPDNDYAHYVPYAQTNYELTQNSGGSIAELLIDYDAVMMSGVTITLTHLASAEGHSPEIHTKTLDNTGEVEVDVKNLGVWTITWTHEGQSYREEFDVHYYGYHHIMLHEGFTWRQWVVAGGINIQKYNSLADLLANQEDIRRLCTIHAAVDYMCEFASVNNDLETIINTGLFAKWVNLRDYALDNMEANSAIKDAMDEADLYGYGELVYEDNEWKPEGNIPVMTSNTAPYGEAFSTSAHSSNPAWQAFDKNVSTSGTFTNAVNNVIGYKFTNPIMPKKLIYSMTDNNKYVVKASNDGVTWDTISEEFTGQAEVNVEIPLTATKYYLYCEICETVKVATSASYTTFREIQFYGHTLKVSVPTMTSNTAPYGEAIRSGVFSSSYEAWKVFDKVTSQSGYEAWASNLVNTNQYVGYDFKKPTVALMCVWKNRNYNVATDIMPPKNHKIQGSNDGTTWEDVTEVITNSVSTAGANHIINMGDNTDSYKAYRMFIVDGIDTGASEGDYVTVGELQFYGKDYSEKEFTNDGSKWLYDHGVYLGNFEFEDNRTYESGNYVSRGEITNIGDSGIKVLSQSSAYSYKALQLSNSVDFTNMNLLRMRNNFGIYYNSDACLEVSSVSGNNYITLESFSSSNGVPGAGVLVGSTKICTSILAQKVYNGINSLNVFELWLE